MTRSDRGLEHVLFSLALAGCGSSNDSREAMKSPWPGFTLTGGLGDGCTASIAAAPAAEYPALSFIPCQSGEPGCGELQFDGVFSAGWFGLDFGMAFDPAGTPTRLLVANGPAERVPLEAVVYDIASGAPMLALRNGQDSFSSGSVGTSSAAKCVLVPTISHDRVSWLAVPSGRTLLSVGQTGFSDVLPLGLRETQADGSALHRTLASDEVLAASQPDGLIHRFRFDGAPDVAAYGPDVKVYLNAVQGGDVFVNDSQSHTYRLADDGTFAGAPSEMAGFRIAGGKAVWYSYAGLVDSVWLADYSADLGVLEASKGKLVDVSYIRGLGIGSGWVVVASSQSALGSTIEITAYEIATGAIRTAKFPENASSPVFLTLVGDHVWVSLLSVTGDRSLRRYTLSPP